MTRFENAEEDTALQGMVMTTLYESLIIHFFNWQIYHG
jgi:hypothetical protein